LNTLRIEQNAPNATMSDVLLSIRALEMAHSNYVGSINAYNRSQVRLMLLLGPNNAMGGENAVNSNPGKLKEAFNGSLNDHQNPPLISLIKK
jgi:hypothetical protein